MAKPDLEQNLGRPSVKGGQKLDRLGRYLKAVDQQAAIVGVFAFHREGMPTEVARKLLHKAAKGQGDVVLEALARVGQKFIR